MRSVLLLLLATASFGFAPPFAVHATLISSEPAANSRLTASPRRIRLVFNEPVEGRLGRISIVYSGATRALRAGADPRDVHAVVAPVDSLGPGGYRVEWRVVSADGHPVDGTFNFSVGDTTLGAQPPPPPAPPTPAPGQEQEKELGPDVWGPAVVGAPLIPAVLRGIGLGALAATAGLLLFLAGAGPDAPQRTDARVRSLTTRFSIAATLFLAAHLVAWLIDTSPDHMLDPSWAASALGTSVGKIELWRVGLTLLALWGWWLARRPWIGFAFAALALMVSGASGHSAAIQPLWGIPSKAIHLLATAMWLGGLLWLIVRPANDDPTTFASDADRVSSRALAAVIAVGFTGIVQTRLFLDSWSGLVTSAYGLIALAKVAGLLVLVAFGAYNRQRVMPRLAAAARTATDVGTLRSSVVREIVVMVIVILLGGLLAYVPPPGEGSASMSSQQSTS